MGNKHRCLIVDDHPIVRKGIRDLLLQEGLCATVVEADNAGTALSAIRREAWDLLILDIALPDKHGLEVLKEVKLLRPHLPVLMLSLYPEREFALRALKAGASGYLTKDRAPSELLSAAKEIVPSDDISRARWPIRWRRFSTKAGRRPLMTSSRTVKCRSCGSSVKGRRCRRLPMTSLSAPGRSVPPVPGRLRNTSSARWPARPIDTRKLLFALQRTGLVTFPRLKFGDGRADITPVWKRGGSGGERRERRGDVIRTHYRRRRESSRCPAPNLA